MIPLLAYHNDPETKAKYVGRMRAHQEADELIHGIYWEGGKGCAIGCTVHSDDHGAYETELGMPEWFAHLEDKIFEGMSVGASRRFPLDLLSAIPIGLAAWDRLYHEFCAYVLRDVCEFDRAEYPDVAAAVDAVIRLHERWTGTDEQAWNAARSASWSVSWSAALSASWSAARVAARMAAESAAWSASWSAESAAWMVVGSKSYDRMGDWLVKWFAAASGVAD